MTTTAQAKDPVAVVAADVEPVRRRPSYPEPFASRMQLQLKRRIGNAFGLRNFGVNFTRLAPGGISALRHSHSQQEEFVYVLEGTPTLVTDGGETLLAPGWCAGFPAGGAAHHLVNRSADEVVYLEVGDRTPGDVVSYPDDDLRAVYGAGGRYEFLHKDGRPY
jgi:uncharacterized cupin superfamily protein